MPAVRRKNNERNRLLHKKSAPETRGAFSLARLRRCRAAGPDDFWASQHRTKTFVISCNHLEALTKKGKSMRLCVTGNIRTLLFLSMLSLGFANTAPALDVQSLIRDIEQQYMGTSSRARTTMQVRTAHWERTLEMEAWSLTRDYFLVRILEPAKERDVATLKRDREVWNFLPKVDRVIKVPPSMMGGSWMGSHITNDDLVKANHIDEDYDLRILEETTTHYVIECLPKAEAAVVWGKIVYRVRKQPRVPERVDYYDEEMVRVRETLFDDVQQIGERIVPLRVTVLPLEKPEEMTVLQYRELVYDLPLDETFFSLRNLKQR